MTIGNVRPSIASDLLQTLISRKPQPAQAGNTPTIQPTAGTGPQLAPTSGNDLLTKPGSQLTLQGFEQAWGTANATYDLDGSGVVDIDDITQWVLRLADQVDGAEPKPKEPEVGAQPPQSAPLTREGFESAWGTANEQYDLDGNGTVDTDDWTRWVLGLPAIPPEVDDAQPTLQTSDATASQNQIQNGNDPTPTTTNEAAAQATVDSVSAAWGGSDPVNDVNGDGVVNIDDYTAVVLGNAQQAATKGGEVKALPAEPVGAPVAIKKPKREADLMPPVAVNRKPGRKSDPLTNRLLLVLRRLRAAGMHDQTTGQPSMYGGKGQDQAMGLAPSDVDARTRSLTGQMLQELRRSGFSSKPPQNIRDLVAAMRLDPSQEKYLMGRLGAAYPAGLGVNTTA